MDILSKTNGKKAFIFECVLKLSWIFLIHICVIIVFLLSFE